MRLRFSIRTLLVLTALAAAACYWWVARPTVIANRFKNALANHDFATAKQLWYDNGLSYIDFAGEGSNPHFPNRSWEVELASRTWEDLRSGVRRLKLALVENSDDPDWSMRRELPPLRASARGVYFDRISHYGGGVY